MAEQAELTCTKSIKVDDGRDNLGRPQFYHKKCGLPASEVEIGGTLAKAKAVLCVQHRLMADRETFTSVNGFPLGKIDKKAKGNGYHQDRLPGTGLIAK